MVRTSSYQPNIYTYAYYYEDAWCNIYAAQKWVLKYCNGDGWLLACVCTFCMASGVSSKVKLCNSVTICKRPLQTSNQHFSWHLNERLALFRFNGIPAFCSAPYVYSATEHFIPTAQLLSPSNVLSQSADDVAGGIFGYQFFGKFEICYMQMAICK